MHISVQHTIGSAWTHINIFQHNMGEMIRPRRFNSLTGKSLPELHCGGVHILWDEAWGDAPQFNVREIMAQIAAGSRNWDIDIRRIPAPVWSGNPHNQLPGNVLEVNLIPLHFSMREPDIRKWRIVADALQRANSHMLKRLNQQDAA